MDFTYLRDPLCNLCLRGEFFKVHRITEDKTKKAVRRQPLNQGGIWGSNPRPPEPQSGALTS